MTAERTSGSVSARLHYLDNLRTFAVMLVLLHHTAITYGASGGWYYHEVDDASLTSIILTLYCAVDQAFFMGLLFFISGYFSPISLDHKGTARFLGDKLVRLGIRSCSMHSYLGRGFLICCIIEPDSHSAIITPVGY